MRKLVGITVAVILSVALIMTAIGCARAPAKKEVTVGNKNFTEQYIVGQMMKQLLEDRGFDVTLKSDLSSMALRKGMKTGEIDICADYTGTGWMTHMKKEYNQEGHTKLYNMVKKADKENGFIWLDPIWNHNTYALASWPEFVKKHDLETMSDLAALYREKDGKITTFVDFEFSQRKDGLPGLEKFYDFKVAEKYLKTGQPGASLTGLKNREQKVGMVFGTDPHVPEYGWHVYKDDKNFYPPYDLTPYVREEVLDKYPKIDDILNELVATFPGGGKEYTPERMDKCREVWQELNGKVAIEKKDADKVAHNYLVDKGLIGE